MGKQDMAWRPERAGKVHCRVAAADDAVQRGDLRGQAVKIAHGINIRIGMDGNTRRTREGRYLC